MTEDAKLLTELNKELKEVKNKTMSQEEQLLERIFTRGSISKEDLLPIRKLYNEKVNPEKDTGCLSCHARMRQVISEIKEYYLKTYIQK